ncbi:hypothetical protein Hte_000402 [Hypoxylon texense]
MTYSNDRLPSFLYRFSDTIIQIYQNDRITKSFVYAISSPDLHNIFTVASKSDHRPKRKLVGQLLSAQSMRSFEPTMLNQVNVFLKQLLKSQTEPVNMSVACRLLGLNIAGLLGFGYDLELQTEDTHRFLTSALSIVNWRVNTTMQCTPLARLKLGRIMDYIPDSPRVKFKAVIKMMITTRLARPTDAEHDLLSVFHDQSDVDIKNIQSGQLWQEAGFFFAAGGETVSSALAAAFFYLSKNPQCYRRLAAEIRSTFSSGVEIRGGTRLAGCRYLRACIDESMRMSPPVPTTLWREAVHDDRQEPLIIDGQVIPPGTQVGVNIYSLHHNEKYFTNPFKFQPERWLDGGQKGLVNPDAFVPFSIGPRGCAGKAMADLETQLVLALTLWYFDFEMAPGYIERQSDKGRTGLTFAVGEFPAYEYFSAQHDGPELIFRPRGSFCEELSQV